MSPRATETSSMGPKAVCDQVISALCVCTILSVTVDRSEFKGHYRLWQNDSSVKTSETVWNGQQYLCMRGRSSEGVLPMLVSYDSAFLLL